MGTLKLRMSSDIMEPRNHMTFSGGAQSVSFVLATGFGTTPAYNVATRLTYCIISTGTEQTEAKAGNPQDSEKDCNRTIQFGVCGNIA